MTMFPPHFSSVNGGLSENGYNCFISLGRGFSDLMADQDDQSTSSTNYEEAGSTSKEINTGDIDIDHDHGPHGPWLQLSLGGAGGGDTESTTTSTHNRLATEDIPSDVHTVTLDLLTGSGGGDGVQQIRQAAPPPPQLVFHDPGFQDHFRTSTTFFMQQHQTAANISSVPFMTLQHQQQYQQHQQQYQQEASYNYLQLIRSFPGNMMTAPVSSSSSFSGSSGRAVHHVHRRLHVARVINPPRRPHSGVWFMLQASQNQAKEPFLPQIPKSYLRIKDGKMTVGLLIKYLVNKLELQSESEVEITCKGHQLLSLLTLQHVRDTIWNSPRNDVGFSVTPQSSATINHLMVLNYGRIA
ncbi:hypothetical protein QVD17_31693 [Tagetes erecta]|uniref:Uncharacterized protein n=1 Tax=Tagetes erecta TaxID=13708 RepID=A0AAD8NH98_TARER|nr:hypothetical protein QVD17_31693 [Tagetes erecta]